MGKDLIKKDGLTVKQERFAKEFLIDYNATQAAVRSGYSKKSAQAIGSFLLSNTIIRARIDKTIADLNTRAEVSAEYVLKGLLDVAQRCMQREPVMRYDFETRTYEQVKDDEGRDVWKFDGNAANRALELIGKHVGLFEADNRQRANVINVQIVDINDMSNSNNDNSQRTTTNNHQHTDTGLSAVLSASA